MWFGTGAAGDDMFWGGVWGFGSLLFVGGRDVSDGVFFGGVGELRHSGVFFGYFIVMAGKDDGDVFINVLAVT